MLRDYFETRIYANYKAMLVSADLALDIEVIDTWRARHSEACRIAYELGVLTNTDIREIKARAEQDVKRAKEV